MRGRDPVTWNEQPPGDASRPASRVGRRAFLAGGGALLTAAGAGLALRAAGSTTAGPQLRSLTPKAAPAAWQHGNTWDWRQFREIPVSSIDNKLRLTSHRGVGTATGVGGPSANDRRIFVRRDLQATDVEVAAEFAAAGHAQFGLALRVQPGVAVVVWQNIFLVATAGLLQGIWEYDGDRIHAVNIDPSRVIKGFVQQVDNAVGDGSTVVVTTRSAHRLSQGDLVAHEGELAGLGMVTVAATPTPTTYSFASPTRGTWTSGRIRRLTTVDRRRVAARVVGDQVSFMQWLPGEAEPDWTDPSHTVTRTLPSQLAAGSAAPTGPGGVGMVLAHLGDGRHIDVTGLHITALD